MFETLETMQIELDVKIKEYNAVLIECRALNNHPLSDGYLAYCKKADKRNDLRDNIDKLKNRIQKTSSIKK